MVCESHLWILDGTAVSSFISTADIMTSYHIIPIHAWWMVSHTGIQAGHPVFNK